MPSKKFIALTNMSRAERWQYYATGRPTVGELTQLVDNRLVDFYVGKVRSVICANNEGEYKFGTKEEALQCAKDFIACAKQEIDDTENSHITDKG